MSTTHSNSKIGPGLTPAQRSQLFARIQQKYTALRSAAEVAHSKVQDPPEVASARKLLQQHDSAKKRGLDTTIQDAGDKAGAARATVTRAQNMEDALVAVEAYEKL